MVSITDPKTAENTSAPGKTVRARFQLPCSAGLFLHKVQIARLVRPFSPQRLTSTEITNPSASPSAGIVKSRLPIFQSPNPAHAANKGASALQQMRLANQCISISLFHSVHFILVVATIISI